MSKEHNDIIEIQQIAAKFRFILMVLEQLPPRKIALNPKINPNPNPNLGQFSSGAIVRIPILMQN